MFISSSKSLNEVKKLQTRVIRILHNYCITLCNQFLEKQMKMKTKMKVRNYCTLCVEIFKALNNLKSTVKKTKKASINDCVRVSKVPWKFCISTICNFAVIYPWNLLISLKVSYFLTVSIIFSVYKQNLTAQ